ncbi:MAG: 4-hydroxy-tetrahydrodipicolinate reductase [Bacteroidia bacterium]|nr:4-hydroxy-tetrahydrodipicolinate reductase [Bacteroidia bacterium]
MNLALIGYGKMGKMIETIALERKHHVVLRLTSKDKWDSVALRHSKTDVAIEFTHPGSAYDNILQCFDANVPVVVGTTGWYQHFDDIQNKCLQKNGSLLYATNFSIGVNLFFKINELVAQLMNKYNSYDVQMLEVHHTQKKDAPSGTAISIAEQIIKQYPNKKNWNLNLHKNDLYIDVHRAGDEKGFHSVCYQSDVDAIEITHHAYSRKGFALGAVLAAEFLKDKKGIFTMKDVLNL